MPNVDFDDDDAATGEYRSRFSRSPSNQRSSILKSSRKVVNSDDDDDEYSSRLSARNRHEEPISSRSDLMSAKPPSGRTPSSLSNRHDSKEYFKSKNTLPAITYPKINNESDDSFTEKYNKFSKKDRKLNDDYKMSKFDSKYDSVYDSFPLRSESKNIDSKYNDFDDADNFKSYKQI